MKYLALLLLLASCRAPDEVSVSPWYGTGMATWSGEGRDYTSHDSGLMLSLTWAVGKRYEAYRNLAALDVSKAGELTMRDSHHDVAPIIIPVPAPVPTPQPEPTPPEPEPPSWDWFAPFKKVPGTLEEALLLGIYVMLALGCLAALVRFALALKRGGVLEMLPFFKKDK